VGRQHQIHLGDLHIHIQEFCIEGVLKNLDLTDLSVPLGEVSRYLVARYSDRFKIHPRKYEEVVASVFREIGYYVRVTSYSNDDGVDAVLLDGKSGDLVGVQAKRYRGKIEAHQIREFAGALVLNHITQGIFVTTSSYTAGAERTAERFSKGPLALDLWDADRLYTALKIGRRSPYASALDPDAPYRDFVHDVSKIPFVSQRSLEIGF
jgi:restriction system protein